MVSTLDYLTLKERVASLEKIVADLMERVIDAEAKRGPGRPPKDRAAA